MNAPLLIASRCYLPRSSTTPRSSVTTSAIDGAQPLHTTVQYHGWNGPNPRGFTSAHHIHAAVERDYVAANIRCEQVATPVAASRPTTNDDEWHQYLGFLRASHALVEQVYALDQAGAFAAAGTPEARAFTNQRLVAGAIELRDLIYTVAAQR